MSNLPISREILAARDVALDRESVMQRLEDFRHVIPSDRPDLVVRESSGRMLPAEPCVPEVAAENLTPDLLRTAIADHGALIVRNMFTAAETDALVDVIDHVLEACHSPRAVRTKLANAYFNPPGNLVSIMPNREKELADLRMFNGITGAVMCVEAPSVAEALLQLFDSHGVKQLVGEYLGEAPCLSVKKWVLRKNLPTKEAAGWHQDGAFMGTDINTINMWLPLSKCGGQTGAPGMDVIPQRLYKIASADGADFEWSVSDEHVRSGALRYAPLAPEFNAGDAFFFDHFYLHRTQVREDFTRPRYAIESWFFGATTFPKSQIPVAW